MELEHLTTEVEQGRIERGEGSYRKRRNTIDVDGSFFGDNVAHVDSNEASSKEKEEEKQRKKAAAEKKKTEEKKKKVAEEKSGKNDEVKRKVCVYYRR